MPLGASITNGFSVAGGYRVPLWNRLRAQTLSVDFVGSLSDGPNTLGDKDHEGHDGWEIDMITNSVSGWLNTQQPDVITLLIGSNDVIRNLDVSNAPARLSALINRITEVSPNAQLLVASLPPIREDIANRREVAFNLTIPGIVNSKVAQGKKVTFVDVNSQLTLNDLADGLHPNEVGYSKIARSWESAMFSIPSIASQTTIDYLSNQTWTSANNNWGPVEKNYSNGEQSAGDGQLMRLNGTTYTNGLGVHSPSDVRYNLGGNYTTFSSDIGVDDEAGSNGTVTFQVWADGAILYDSGRMSGSTSTKTLNIDVTGKQELKLITTNNGDGSSYDHANWANAHLTKGGIVGTNSNDVLTGNAATNVFVGSNGADTLTGGGGSDLFTYRAPSEGNDIITDFSPDDSFYISAATFGGGLKFGVPLQQNAAANGVFVSGTTPTPLGQSGNFLYNTSTGLLSFDRDGTGLGEAIAIATLAGAPSLSASQFSIGS